MPDKPIPRRLRFEVLRRDNHTCRYCGASSPDVPLTVDHVIPRALGGSDDPTNLVAACRDCNSGKASTSPDEQVVADVDQKALQWATALEQAAELRRSELKTLDETVNQVATYWDGWRDSHDNGVPKDASWRYSVERFLTIGLDVADLHRMIMIAMESKAGLTDKWRYFCGCCWKEITRRQDMALAALDTPVDPYANDETDPPPEYDHGFDDGYRVGFESGHRSGLNEGREEAEVAYQDGFRSGVNRLKNYDPSDIDLSDRDLSDIGWE